MVFNILADGSTGFMVTWGAPDAAVPLATVRGFGSHEAAQDFIMKFLVVLGRSAKMGIPPVAAKES